MTFIHAIRKQTFCVLVLLSIFLCCGAQGLKYTAGKQSWNADSLGNHRFIINLSTAEANKKSKVVQVTIPWRRRDINPEEKRIIVVDGKTGRRILNVATNTINREVGHIFFEPVSGAGNYYAYYMPYKNEGRSNYPKGVYLRPDSTASQEWLHTINLPGNYPQASAVEYQSIDEFNSFYPMEFIASEEETKKFIRQDKNASYFVFPEDRRHPIRMKNDLPQRWTQSGSQKKFSGQVKQGEYFTF